MIAWALNHPYTAGAIFYAVFIGGTLLFMRGCSEGDQQ